MNPKTIIDGLLADLAAKLMDSDDTVTGTMAETNAQPFEFDTGEVDSADWVGNSQNRIEFTASIHLTGEQDEDSGFNGDEIDLTVSGIAVRTGNTWTFEETTVESCETNA